MDKRVEINQFPESFVVVAFVASMSCDKSQCDKSQSLTTCGGHFLDVGAVYDVDLLMIVI